ncbi:MAG TPA: TerC family protein [Anaerolineales bacterium]|jgi:predicted tellurium resistance membrane protein TerC|nr:TerC family protein [Anaerolineales bacterium]
MEWILDPEVWIALLTLTALEIVLGIDNLVFISILAGKLPKEQQGRAGQVGLGLALVTRILLLLSIAWITRLTTPLFTLPLLDQAVSGKDLILFSGGLFLIGKSTFEIHDKLEGKEGHSEARIRATFVNVIIQIMLLDVVFSLDSVITAVGMVENVAIMVSAIIIAIIIMVISVKSISQFVEQHPTIKMLALAFLLLIGFSLVVEGLHQEIPKGYIYFAMGFSVLVEILNLRLRTKAPVPVHLREPYIGKEKPAP